MIVHRLFACQTLEVLNMTVYLCRTTFPISTDATLRIANATQTHQLWTSVSSALSGCINNPQNGIVIVPWTAHFVCKIYKYTTTFCCSFMFSFWLSEEGQRICVAAFPIINIWLQQISLPCTEIYQPICSFIAMTVANNCKWTRCSVLCYMLFLSFILRQKQLKLV